MSNSSSSSFILSDKDFPTVRSVATYMLNKKIEHYSDYDDYDSDNFSDNKYIERLQKLDENQTVSFPSTNYDTYIRKVGDCYLVATCNNIPWDLYSYNYRVLTESAKDALRDLLNSCKDEDDGGRIEDLISNNYGEEFYSFGKDFYDLDKEIVGVEVYETCEKCKKNGRESYYLWDTINYGKICLVCNPYFQRKDKLIAINKSAEENE